MSKHDDKSAAADKANALGAGQEVSSLLPYNHLFCDAKTIICVNIVCYSEKRKRSEIPLCEPRCCTFSTI